MKNYIKIILLVALFPICSLGGYFAGKIVKEAKQNRPVKEKVIEVPITQVTTSQTTAEVKADVKAEVAEVVEEVVQESDTTKATESVAIMIKPEIVSVSNPVRDAAGKYSFEVKAVSADESPLDFVLYSDKECTAMVLNQSENIFKNIEPSASGVYYLIAINALSGDRSEVRSIKGFTKPVMYEKVLKEDLQTICNSGDYSTAPAKYSHRFVPKGLVIEAKNMNPGEKPVATVSDICLKVMMGTWSSVVVENLEYDSQNRVKKIVIVINY